MWDRWVTFDCYGTLVDWETGIRGTMAWLWPGEDPSRLSAAYHRAEPHVQSGSGMPYREVLATALEMVADGEGLEVPAGKEGALSDSLPSWPVFPEVTGEMVELRSRGWKLAILSNTDPDLLQSTIHSIGVVPDIVITAREAGSYKPAHGHWLRFRDLSGADPGRHVHVAASLFHDIAPARELGVPAVWINRLRETSELPRDAELSSLTGLPDILDRLVAGDRDA
jgi:2-haloacid dehalogenase